MMNDCDFFLGTNTQALCSGFVAICGDKLDVHVVGGLDYKFVGTTTVSSAATHDAGLLVVDATLTIKLTDATKRAEVQSAVLPKEYLFGTKSTTNLYTPNRTRLTLLMSLKSNDLDRHKTFEGLFADDSEQPAFDVLIKAFLRDSSADRKDLREIAHAKLLSRAGCLLPVVHHFFDDTFHFLVFDKPRGPTLREFIGPNAIPLSFTQQTEIARQLVEIVSKMHEEQYAHNALTPDVIVLDASVTDSKTVPRVFLQDVRKVKRAATGSSNSTSKSGATSTGARQVWLAPEQLQKPTYTSRLEHDLFSLGLLVYALASGGSHAYDDDNGSAVSDNERLRRLLQEENNPRALNGSIERDGFNPLLDVARRLLLQGASSESGMARDLLKKHPAFWTHDRFVQFLMCDGVQKNLQQGVCFDLKGTGEKKTDLAQLQREHGTVVPLLFPTELRLSEDEEKSAFEDETHWQCWQNVKHIVAWVPVVGGKPLKQKRDERFGNDAPLCLVHVFTALRNMLAHAGHWISFVELVPNHPLPYPNAWGATLQYLRHGSPAEADALKHVVVAPVVGPLTTGAEVVPIDPVTGDALYDFAELTPRAEKALGFVVDALRRSPARLDHLPMRLWMLAHDVHTDFDVLSNVKIAPGDWESFFF